MERTETQTLTSNPIPFFISPGSNSKSLALFTNTYYFDFRPLLRWYFSLWESGKVVYLWIIKLLMLIFQGFEYISYIRTCQEIKPAEGLSTFSCFFLSLSSPTVFNTYKAQLETVIIEEVEIEPTLWVGGKVPSLQHCFSPLNTQMYYYFISSH